MEKTIVLKELVIEVDGELVHIPFNRYDLSVYHDTCECCGTSYKVTYDFKHDGERREVILRNDGLR